MEAFAESVPAPVRLKSIFSPATTDERERNFESYWAFTHGRDGDILEAGSVAQVLDAPQQDYTRTLVAAAS